jgi:hypothetical protein
MNPNPARPLPRPLSQVELDAKAFGVELFKLGPNAAVTAFRMTRIMGFEWSERRAIEAARCLVDHRLAERAGKASRYRLTELGKVRAQAWVAGHE